MIAGQQRIVAAVQSDTQFTTTVTWSTTTAVPSAVKVIAYSLTGTVAATVRGATTGVVSVVNGSATITGVGTLFTTEATNSAAGTANVTGRYILINGRVRQINAIASDTSITVNAAMDFTDSNLTYKVLPRGTIAVTAGGTAVTGTGTNFASDLVSGDQIWIGDELKTITFSGGATTAATLSTALTQAVTGIPFQREDSYITGTSTIFSTELRVNDEIMINGSEYSVTQIISDTSIRLNRMVTGTLSGATVYKKKKIHGWSLEGTREGNGTGTAGGKLGIATTSLVAAGSVYPIGNTTITVASATGFTQNNIIKIQAAGGPATQLTGTINTVAASSTITGTNTLFTTELHVGAEIAIAGQYFTVTAIASNTSMTVSASMSVTGPVPYYRTIPLYTFISAVAGAIITLGTPLQNTIYSTGANPPVVFTPGNNTTATIAGGDFIEYVYSAPNKSAEASTALSVTSNDRKYMGFRYYPLSLTGVITTANASYNTPVYERWVAGYGAAGGVGINLADQSGGMVAQVSQSLTTLTVNAIPSGSISVGMVISNAVGTVSSFGTGTGGTGTYTVSGSQTLTNVTVTGAISGVTDVTATTQTTGGFLYLFAQPRHFIVQGKSFANVASAWQGVVEFERAQPEDTGTGLGTSAGITYNTGAPVSASPGVAPWPTYAYIHSNRFPVGSQQTPTLPVAQAQPVHGGVFAVPRMRNSTGDLVGANSHIYSAATITTGRWGHLYELGSSGAYQTTNAPVGGILTTNPANTIPQPHVGQLVPVYTNVYNSKRFMFSPVVVLGPTYDPDIRGRMYGLKVIPSALGTLMDTVSITSDSDFFYDSTQAAADHWVLTASVQTFRFTMSGTTISQSFRSLEDGTGPQTAQSVTGFTNSFRWAIPA